MRMKYLLGLAAPLVLLLPLSAQATGSWPAGEKTKYMQECTNAASQSIDAKAAKEHCDCGAKVLESKFTTAEIAALTNQKTPPDPALRDRALKEVSACKAKK